MSKDAQMDSEASKKESAASKGDSKDIKVGSGASKSASGKELKEQVIARLKGASVNEESVNNGGNQDNGSKNNPDEASIDTKALVAAVLQEKKDEAEKKKKNDSESPDKNKISELTRKVEKLTEKNTELMQQYQDVIVKAQRELRQGYAQGSNDIKEGSEEYWDALADKTGVDPDFLKGAVPALEFAFGKNIKPLIDKQEARIKELESKLDAINNGDVFKSDPLFPVLKDTYERILAEDPAVKSVPAEMKSSLAWKLAKAEEQEMMLRVASKKSKSSGVATLIPGDKGSVNASLNVNPNEGSLNAEERSFIKQRLRLSDKTLKNWGKPREFKER